VDSVGVKPADWESQMITYRQKTDVLLKLVSFRIGLQFKFMRDGKDKRAFAGFGLSQDSGLADGVDNAC